MSNALAPAVFCVSLRQREIKLFLYCAGIYGHSMTPNFALSLSFDGIALLRRVPDGWHLVGEVPLDAPDLPSALDDLRAKGLALDPSGLRTKLVIPGDQIRYMTLDTTETTDAAVRRALEGATPYALDELVIDTLRTDGHTYVAAVARETLEEAEAFAVEHDFNPVAFVALPAPDTVTQEVLFGPTQTAGTVQITRDSRAVRQTGIAVIPAPFATTPSDPDASVPAPPELTISKPTTAVPTQGPQANVPVFASRSKVPAPTIDPVRLSASRPQLSPLMATQDRETPAFASPRIASHVPATPMSGTVMPHGVAVATPVTPPATEPLFTRRKEPPAPILGKGRAASPVAVRAQTPSAAPVSALTAAAAPMTSQAPYGPVTEKVRHPAEASADPLAAARSKPRFLGLIMTAILVLVLLLVGLWASTLPPEGIAGWFRSNAPVTDIAAVADSARITSPVASVDATTPDAPQESLAAPATVQPTAAKPAPSAIVPQDVAAAAPPLPILRAPVGRILSPDEANRIYAATGVYQRAPRIDGTPDSTPLGDVGPFATVTAPDPLTPPDMPTLDTIAPDAVIAAPVSPPGPDVVFNRDSRGNILATTAGTLTPQGVIVIAGAPDVRPVLRPGTPRVPAAPISPVARPADLVPEPAPDADAAAATSGTAAPVPGTDTPAFVAGPPPLRPVVRPSDAAALTVTGPAESLADATPVPPYTGARPRVRPSGLVAVSAPSDAAEAVIAAYTGARPVLRPAALAPAPIEETPEPEPTPEPIVAADINAVAAAIAAAAPTSSFRNRTALAVSVAPRPAPRPRNFTQVVARARQAAAPPPAAAAPTQTAATAATPAPPTIVTPSGNVPGGVARAATMDNAINLRQMNLVGVYGKPNARRALVRLGNGRYVKVEVGSALDGGQVTAIGDNALNFVKRGKTYALVLPG